MSSEFVRNIHHTKLRGKTTEPLDTNIQNDILSDENNAYIRNEDPKSPYEHYVLLTGSLETDELNSSESAILEVQKNSKHSITLKPKHTKITTKTDTIKVSENKPLEFELDDTQVKTNKENIEINKTAIAKNAGDIKRNTNSIGDNNSAIIQNRNNLTKLNKLMVFAGNDWFSYFSYEGDKITVDIDNISKDSSLKGEPCKMIFYYADNKHNDFSLKIGEPTKITTNDGTVKIQMIEYMGNKKILSNDPIKPI